MYLNFYGLNKEPFNITPDPAFLFLSPSHKEALAVVMYGVENRKGFIVITGEVGLGKTTILRSYLELAVNERLKTVYLFNANVTFPALLETICRELAIPVIADDPGEMLRQLHLSLIQEYQRGFNIVLIVDEAQNMPLETLENIRMLSNLETDTDKLIQVIFIGQPEFDQLLDRQELRQLKQRIAVRAVIAPLNPKESAAYIRFRLARAGNREAAIFSPGALKRIVRHARGIPRVLNILCDTALITAFGYQKKQVNRAIAAEQARRYTGEVSSAAFDPGFMIDKKDPELVKRWASGLMGAFWRVMTVFFAKPPAVAGEPIADLMLSYRDRSAINGALFKLDKRVEKPDKAMNDEILGKRLWDELVLLTGLTPE